MKDNKRNFSQLFYFLIGLIATALLGMVVSQLLLSKNQQYNENMLWKYTILFYAATMAYVFWLYFYKNYLPFIPNIVKFIGVNFLLSLPFFVVLIWTRSISINAIMVVLPAQVMFLAIVFSWHVATEINPGLKKNTNKITLKGFIIGAIAFFIAGLLQLPNIIGLSVGTFIILCYVLLILKGAIKDGPHS